VELIAPEMVGYTIWARAPLMPASSARTHRDLFMMVCVGFILFRIFFPEVLSGRVATTCAKLFSRRSEHLKVVRDNFHNWLTQRRGCHTSLDSPGTTWRWQVMQAPYNTEWVNLGVIVQIIVASVKRFLK
jgi:hypothetical protein